MASFSNVTLALLGAAGAYIYYLKSELQKANKRADDRANGRVNKSVSLDKPKVVDFVKSSDIEDAGKLVLCRCWKSSKFPYCGTEH